MSETPKRFYNTLLTISNFGKKPINRSMIKKLKDFTDNQKRNYISILGKMGCINRTDEGYVPVLVKLI